MFCKFGVRKMNSDIITAVLYSCPSSNLGIQKKAFTPFHSHEVFGSIYQLLPHFIFQLVFIPRTAAGTPTLTSLPRASRHVGLCFTLNIHRDDQ